ncbi:alpha/beta fold hydrolase [Guptibacillus hwajinpoensis]|uniref:Pimeloyl-ACP methyl ester carboxylesterase n=1 Tax=Guptibacillus hwajinpoensis TaxID=208199 RepID=A0ABU0JXK9_9BACL|nr:alpha/beta hydrolase [Alkalihalobacillus hemicentroti]MDQ0481806.1 pimeloyl-ACP methyl ester carboxylesterase [Alkalihalobacillus hemicentroti]
MLVAQNFQQNKEKIKGIDIHYEYYKNADAVDQPVLTLLHGFLSSSFSYRRLIPLLTKAYTVVAIDLPPFGKSEKSNRFVHSYQNYAEVVVELLEKLSIEQTVMIGHSMGGQVAMRASALNENLVSKNVLLCSSGYLEKAKQSLVYTSYLPFFSIYLKRWLYRKGVKGNLINCVYDPKLIDEEMMDGYIQPFFNESIFRSLVRMIRDREGDLSSDELKQIHTPSLLIWGENDRVVPLKVGKRLSSDLPNAELIVYEKTGHLLPEERPRLIMKDIERFIQM